ncbi:hypothetical protein F6S08_25520 [Pseudomonas sp. JV449]|uniref:hypothetical protein n=1 Tax=Pseudomonas sp. JV449 TaxID=1890658 RepID=UPI0028E1794A|nr:hypothetical protein [Pseudomonas sp. JV449]MDT9634561.1 hypothetical protein [Pseudomonas sp. JV449]
MTIKTVKALAVVLMMLPALSWAALFDCAVYDKTINAGQGAEARQADESVEAGSVDHAQATLRKDQRWNDADRYIIKCRPSGE